MVIYLPYNPYIFTCIMLIDFLYNDYLYTCTVIKVMPVLGVSESGLSIATTVSVYLYSWFLRDS